jgi:fructose-1,6-bisphosphatase/inositol monophosphatase family enzyme
MLGSGDAERVADLIRETAAAELVPRFRNLAEGDVRQKKPGDYVTVADVASELRLATGLAKILPGVPVVGEEAVETDPSLLELIGRPEGACWIVDPLDGTANFASGNDTFAVIICLVHRAEAVAAWILDVPRGRMAVAMKGQGVMLEGVLVRGVPPEPDHKLSGFVGPRVRKTFDQQLPPAQKAQLGQTRTLRCAGIEYLEILAGLTDFSLYRNTKPWDHAGGALMLAEAGGGAVRLDGTPYTPAQSIQAGIMGAASAKGLLRIRDLFDAARLPLLAARPVVANGE